MGILLILDPSLVVSIYFGNRFYYCNVHELDALPDSHVQDTEYLKNAAELLY